MIQMSESTANAVYDVLVEHAGASPTARHDFVYHQARSEHPPTEYRFQGRLGFGGKFWCNRGRWYVSCYREDENPERRAMIDTTNTALATLEESP